MGTKPEFVLRLSREGRNDILRQAEFVVADMSQFLITTVSDEDTNGGQEVKDR